MTLALAGLGAACARSFAGSGWPPPVQRIDAAPVYSPEAALATFAVPPGFRVELVAAEPLIEDPIAIDIDPDGRLWVVEMRGFMTDLVESKGDFEPISRISVLEDIDGDGRMDRSTVFLDSLVLPRAVLPLRDGALVAEPPHLWFARDIDGDLRADQKILVRDDYGDPAGNQEAMANGLVWGMDNWIHSTHYGGRFRRVGGGFRHQETLEVGQFGLSMDDYGRWYRNWNSSPLHVDLLDAGYHARNPRLRGGGAVDVRIADSAREVWPIRNTPGANRGYREGTFRANGTLREFTAASGPAVYRGHRYPEHFRGNVFVAEPVGNLVRRFRIVDRGDGTLEAVNAYHQAEFMASTDERFRPVNLYSAPDGALYVVDMYNGVIEHRDFLTQYLRKHIDERGLARPEGLGRIYRIVHESTPPDRRRPQLYGASDRELVRLLSHPNGWWRDAAQQLLVERGAAGSAALLTKVAATARAPVTRLHALWTLEGLAALELPTVQRALSDRDARVRAAAIRLYEPWLRTGNQDVLERLAALVGDPAPEVRLQLAATLGAAPPPGADRVLASLLAGAGHQPYLIAAAISGLNGREVDFMAHLLRSGEIRGDGHTPALESLAATVANAADAVEIDRMLHLVRDGAGVPRRQRLAVLAGIEAQLRRPQGGVSLWKLDAEPNALRRLAASADPGVQATAERLAAATVWPGKPGYTEPKGTLVTDQARQRYRDGEQLYLRSCASCHRPDGRGQQGVAASLVGSPWVLGPPLRAARIVLDGKEGVELLMPPHRSALDDQQVAAILTYVRNAWGNQAPAVSPSQIQDVREETAARGRPWTEEELRIMLH